MKILIDDVDYIKVVKSVSWSGDLDQASRTLDIRINLASLDDYVRTGSNVLAFEKAMDEPFFSGKVFKSSIDEESLSLSLKCYDPLFNLSKSMVNMKFNQVTADQMARSVLKEFNINEGGIFKASAKQSLIAIAYNAYQVIFEAYQKEAENTGHQFNIVMDSKGLNVLNVTDNMISDVFDSAYFVINSNTSENADKVINRAVIVNNDGKVVTEKSVSDLISRFGLIQTVKKASSSNEMNIDDLLESVLYDSSVECLGDMRCVAGTIIRILDSRTRKVGQYLIESDSHNFSDGIHTMNLGIRLLKIEGE